MVSRRSAFWAALAIGWMVLTGPAMAAAQPPDDPLFKYQWNLRAIQIPGAWAISRGKGATVAVLDTGVAYRNRGRFRRAPDLAGTRFVAGYDFIDDDPYPLDEPPRDERRSHGTLMASIIAATAANALGAAGVAPEARIMPIRVLRPDLSGSARDIARGLRFAADHGADVANLSISGRSPAKVLTEAVAYAVARGVTVIAASGNDGAEEVGWPAADPNVIAVGAVARDRTRATYSNYGRELDLVAPGGAGERVDTGYGSSDGIVGQAVKGGPASFCFCFSASTSAAAAQVSGVAAMLIGSGRATRPAAVRAALLAGARDLGPSGRDNEYGAGLVQALRALQPETPPVSPPATSTLAEGGKKSEPSSDAWPGAAIVGLLAAGTAAVAAAMWRRRRRADGERDLVSKDI